MHIHQAFGVQIQTGVIAFMTMRKLKLTATKRQGLKDLMPLMNRTLILLVIMERAMMLLNCIIAHSRTKEPCYTNN